jgi:hypothetical protein
MTVVRARASDLALRTARQPMDDGTRIGVFAAEASKDVERISKCARIRYGGTGSDDARIVADDIGDREGQTWAGCARGEPAALDRRKMFANGVERVDIRSRPQ